MRLRKWLPLILLIALSLTVGCTNETSRAPLVPLVAEHAHSPRSQYTSTGDSPFVVVYVLERETGWLVPVSVTREPSQAPLDQATSVLNSAPIPESFRALGSSESRIQAVTLRDSVLTLDMPPAFEAWVMRNQAESRAFIKSVALTFTSFQDISAVRFSINGLPMQVSVSPFQLAEPISRPTAVNSSLAENNSVVIYLRLRGADLLVPWAVPSTRREPAVALQQLIGFRGHALLTSPALGSLSVQSVRVEEGLAVVNLDKTSVSLFLQGALSQQLVLDALVYTMLEFPDINEVQFLVDGRVLAPLGSHLDLSRPIGRTAINQAR